MHARSASHGRVTAGIPISRPIALQDQSPSARFQADCAARNRTNYLFRGIHALWTFRPVRSRSWSNAGEWRPRGRWHPPIETTALENLQRAAMHGIAVTIIIQTNCSLGNAQLSDSRHTMLVTGSTDGPRKHVIEKLAPSGAHMPVHGRDASRAPARYSRKIRSAPAGGTRRGGRRRTGRPSAGPPPGSRSCWSPMSGPTGPAPHPPLPSASDRRPSTA